MSDKRTEILLTAEELFSDKGFDGTSVRDIAQKAGVNLAMISYYFGSKEKLLEALIEYRSKYTFGILEELSKDEHMSPWDKIDRLVDFYTEKIISHSRIHNIISTDFPVERSAEVKDLVTHMKFKNMEQIKKIILDGQKKKVFRKIDIEFTIGSFMGTITQLTLSKNFYCRLLNMDQSDDETYRKKVIQRLRTHLKQLLRAHLDIRNEE